MNEIARQNTVLSILIKDKLTISVPDSLPPQLVRENKVAVPLSGRRGHHLPFYIYVLICVIRDDERAA